MTITPESHQFHILHHLSFSFCYPLHLWLWERLTSLKPAHSSEQISLWAAVRSWQSSPFKIIKISICWRLCTTQEHLMRKAVVICNHRNWLCDPVIYNFLISSWALILVLVSLRLQRWHSVDSQPVYVKAGCGTERWDWGRWIALQKIARRNYTYWSVSFRSQNPPVWCPITHPKGPSGIKKLVNLKYQTFFCFVLLLLLLHFSSTALWFISFCLKDGKWIESLDIVRH